MKNSFSLLALSTALFTGSIAQAATASFSSPSVPSVSRAQVQAELAAARDAGTIQNGEETYVPPSISTRSRTDVKAELAAAVAAGTIQRGDQTYVPPTFSTMSRAEVKADTAAWNKASLGDEWRGNATPDIYSTAYGEKFADYQYLANQDQPRVGSAS